MYYNNLVTKINTEDFNFDLSEVKTIETFEDLLNLLSKASKLLRRGFIACKETYSESIATHMYKLMFAAHFLITEKGLKLDVMKCTYMLMVHDLAECYINDAIPEDRIDAERKKIVEHNIIQKLFSTNNEALKPLMNALIEAYFEFEENKTPEAVFAHNLDKLDFLQEVKRLYNEDQFVPSETSNLTNEYVSKNLTKYADNLEVNLDQSKLVNIKNFYKIIE